MATVKYVLKLDDQLSKGLATTAANVHAVVAALRELDGQAKGVEGALVGTGRASKVTAAQAQDAAQALQQMAKTAGVTAEQSEKLAAASKRASAAAKAQAEATRLKREVLKKAREEAKAAAVAARTRAKEEAKAAKTAAAAAKIEERERQKLIATLDRQREADERVRLGKEQAQAVAELRAIDLLIAKMREKNLVSQAEIDLLERRKQQVRENLAIETAAAKNLGTRIDRGFGPQGTRRSPIGRGVLSSHVKNVTKDMKALNSAARSTARQLPDVFSQLATGTPITQIFMQQGLQVVDMVEAETSAFTKLGARLSASPGLISGATLALGGLATAGVVTVNIVDEMRESVNVLNRTMKDNEAQIASTRQKVVAAAAAFRELRKSTREARRDNLVFAGDLAPEDADLQRVVERVDERTFEGIRDAFLLIEKLKKQISDAEKVGLSMLATLNEQEAAKRTIAEKTVELAQAEETLARMQAARDAEIAVRTEGLFERKYARIEEEAAQAEKAEERKTAAVAKGERERSQAANARLAALDRLATMARQAETSQLDGIAAVNAAMEDQLALIDKIAGAFGTLDDDETAAIGKAREAVKSNAAAKVAAIQAAEADAANEEAAKAAIAAQEAAQGLKEAVDLLAGKIRTDGLKSLLGGDASGAIEAGLGKALQLAGKGAGATGAEGAAFALGAAAAPVAAGVVGLKAVGDMGADGVEELAEDTVDAIVAGIDALPEILVEVAPKLGIAIATEIVPALLKLPLEFAKALGEALKDLFTRGRERRQDRRERRRNTKAEARTTRSFRSGTSIVQRDGPAMLHQGELVVPVNGAMSQDSASRVRRQAGADGGGTMMGGVRIRPVTIDAVVLGITSKQATGPWSHWAGYGPKMGSHR